MNEIINEFKKMKAAIPGYAEWTVRDLNDIYEEYRRSMLALVKEGTISGALHQHLTQNSVDIRGAIERALKKAVTKRAKEDKRRAFDFAATELRLDIDSIITALEESNKAT